jgi:hypothetical protein
MAIGHVDQWELDHLANRIERALRSARIRARIHGGESSADRVRYHLAPQSDSLETRLKAAVQSVAEQTGLPEVHVIRERAGLVLEVYTPGLRYLPLLNLVEPEDLSGILLGMQPDGKPFLFDWSDQSIIVSGPSACGKSEFQRTFLLAAAHKYSPMQLQIIGIDFSGRELTFLNSLPHVLTDVITHVDEAIRMLDWLLRDAGTVKTNIVVAVDELGLASEGYDRAMLERITQVSRIPGVRVLLSDPGFGEVREQVGWVEFRSRSLGHFKMRGGADTRELRAAYVPVRDLSKAISVCLDN